MIIFRVLVLAMVMFGAMSELGLVWTLADISMGFMAIVNIIALFMLSSIVLWLSRDYLSQLKAGKVPTFDRSQHPTLDKQIPKDIW